MAKFESGGHRLVASRFLYGTRTWQCPGLSCHTCMCAENHAFLLLPNGLPVDRTTCYKKEGTGQKEAAWLRGARVMRRWAAGKGVTPVSKEERRVSSYHPLAVPGAKRRLQFSRATETTLVVETKACWKAATKVASPVSSPKLPLLAVQTQTTTESNW